MKEKFFFILRVSAAAVFIGSGSTKLMEPYQNFLAAVYSYKVLSGEAARGFAILVPWAELILGAWLLVGLWTRKTALCLLGLNSVFLAAIVQALVRHLPVTDCGCFGSSVASLSLSKVLWLDIGLWLVLAALFSSRSSEFLSLDRRFDFPLS